MSGSLENKTIASTYRDLLQVPNNNAGVDGTLRNVCDGEGTVTPLRISTTTADMPVTATGTTVARSLSDRAADIINLRDYIPAGTNTATTNCAPFFQAAVNAALASAPSGAEIVIPRGNYGFSSRVNIPKTAGRYVTLRFDEGAVIQNIGGYADFLFYVGSNTVAPGGSNVTFDGLHVLGNTGCRAVFLENGNATKFLNCKFVLCFQGVFMTASYGVEFERCMWEVGQSYSVISTTSAHHTVFYQCKFFTTGQDGTYTLWFQGSTDNLVIRDCDFEVGWCMLCLEAGGTALTLEGNYIEYFSNTPFFFNAPVFGASIRNNWIALAGLPGSPAVASLVLNNITGGCFENNSHYAINISVNEPTVTDFDWNGNRLIAGGGGTIPPNERTFFGATTMRADDVSGDVIRIQARTPTDVPQFTHRSSTGALRWQQVYGNTEWAMFYAGNSRLVLTDLGHLQPGGATGTQNIGASAARWGTTFTVSLNASGGGVFGADVSAQGSFYSNLPSPLVVLNKTGAAAGNSAAILGRQNGAERWHLRICNDEAETGGNAGSNFQLLRFSDGGGLVGIPLHIRRSDGGTTLAGAFLNVRTEESSNGVTLAGASVGVLPSIRATGADANIPLVVGPKGTGALIAQMPDGAATGGGTRGTYAVDWQTVRNIASEVAAGNAAVIAGGAANTASAEYSSVAGGVFNAANGYVSWIPGGWSASTHFRTGAGAWASGLFSSAGDAQAFEMVLRRQGTDATAIVLTSDNAVHNQFNQLTLRNSSSFTALLLVCARQTGGSGGTIGDSAHWVIHVAGKRGPNAASTVLSRVFILDGFRDTGAATWGVAVNADIINGAMIVQAVGEADKTIRWVARWAGVEVAA